MVKILRAADPVQLQGRITEYLATIKDTHVLLNCSITSHRGLALVALTLTEIG